MESSEDDVDGSQQERGTCDVAVKPTAAARIQDASATCKRERRNPQPNTPSRLIKADASNIAAGTPHSKHAQGLQTKSRVVQFSFMNRLYHVFPCPRLYSVPK